MAFTGHVEDRIPIRELVGAYSDAVMRQDEGLYRLLERRRHPHWPGHRMYRPLRAPRAMAPILDHPRENGVLRRDRRD